MKSSDPIQSHTLRDGDVEITVLSLGCVVQHWRVGAVPVVLGYADPEAYRSNPVAMGALCGRVVNRIRDARFELDGEVWSLDVNAPPHHIHGGSGGFGLSNWSLTPDGDRAVTLRLHAPHLDQGYPGAVDAEVRMTLDGHRLRYDMTVVPDRETPVNLAQHLYFNLNGFGDVRDHSLRIAASRYTPNGPDLMPTGEIADVAGTDYDFRSAKVLAAADPDRKGWDGNLVLDAGPGPQAEVTAPNGMRLRLWTDQRGIQLYTSNTLGAHTEPNDSAAHAPFAGICLEAQNLPGALKHPQFGSILCSPANPYRQQLEIEITP
ncbi:aldose epimerase family protein [Puniceibacterium confluentis]|uniref:aldose epimerase family protein n=1 Tax=Puniceibacterium confluentis TaxID=1958944 RepID=UPI0016480D78|nr:aldose epimerase family protein [Puniceibacterium confluentis]